MYAEDSFFTLSGAGQFGLALLSLGLAAVVLVVVWSGVKGRGLGVRIAVAVIVFVAFVWLSPQVYYTYYRLIIEGLPRQWVIGAPEPMDALRYLSFTGPATLSAHGQGVLGWAALGVAALRRVA